MSRRSADVPLSVHEKLLLAAVRLEREGTSPFTAEDLVVAAWEDYPDTFGLAGHNDADGRPRFPNSNRVFAEIMGSKPIRKQGLLEKKGTKLFRVTEAGRQRAANLGGRETGISKKAVFGRETQREFRRLVRSRALEKHDDDRDDDITFNDAAGFWGISARSSAMEYQGRMGQVVGVLQAALDATRDGPLVLQHGGQPFGHRDVEELAAFHAELQVKFASEIDVILRRRDERAQGTH
jgi:hypothetical protein